MFSILISSFVIMTASIVGVITTWKTVGAFVEHHLKYLVSFSAGVFAVIAYSLSQETIEISSSIGSGVLWIAVGFLTLIVFFKVVPGFHHHHDEECHNDTHCSPASINPKRVMISDALHNIGDGILLTASFSLSVTFGWMTALSIFIHELVQELSEFFVLREAGYSVKKALRVNFFVSSTILLGSLGSFFLVSYFGFLEAPILGIAAGSFIVVVLFDLIPHSVRHSKRSQTYSLHFLWFVLGIFLMFGINLATHEAHEHDEVATNKVEQSEILG